MSSRRTPTGLSGILALDKPQSVTSHDVVNVVRRITGERRVGHAGTLDPMATGLLVVCVGPATRLADYLMVGTKTYEARISFGAATNTDDADGQVVKACALPEHLLDTALAEDVLARLHGPLSQVPPAFSAIKKDGVKAYKAARAGNELELEPRNVHLYSTRLLAVEENYWDVELVVSKGFYVRSFARDLGEQLGSAAHLGALRRIGSGGISVEQATQLDDLKALDSTDALPFFNPVAALGLPMYEIDADQARSVQNGMALTLSATQLRQPKCMAAQTGVCKEEFASEALVSIVYENTLLALYTLAGAGGYSRPKVVIPGGISLGC